MIVIVDTSVLSLAFRRRVNAELSSQENSLIGVLKRLALARRGVLTGMVRQEVLSGIRSMKQFEQLREILDGFVYIQPDQVDHDTAADCYNRCRARGIAAGNVDMLVCAMAIRRGASVLTVDDDFRHYAKCVSVVLYDLA